MSRADLRRLQWAKLTSGLGRTSASNSFYRSRLGAAGFDANFRIRDWDDFARLPFTTKEDLLADQQANPPYGSNLALPWRDYIRIHQTTGTSGRRLRWLDSADGWRWLTEELWPILFDAVELTREDRLLFAFSFGPFLGFWAAFDAAQKRGAFVLASGGMTSVARLQLLLDHHITFVLCTPTYALRLAEVAAETGVDLAGSSVRALLLAGEPGGSIPAIRNRIEAAWGARVFDHSGMTEIGSLGIEYVDHPGKLFLIEDHCIAEFLKPGTSEPADAGDLSELVLTNLGRWDSPLIRYRTGDLVRWRDDLKPAGANYPYVHLDGGILGRTDDMLWLKGNNVYPSAIEATLLGLAGLAEFRLEVERNDGTDELTIVVEPTPEAEVEGLLATVVRAVQDRLYFRPRATAVVPGTLPRFEMKAQRLVRKSRLPP